MSCARSATAPDTIVADTEAKVNCHHQNAQCFPYEPGATVPVPLKSKAISSSRIYAIVKKRVLSALAVPMKGLVPSKATA